jgi:hypothetical protein
MDMLTARRSSGERSQVSAKSSASHPTSRACQSTLVILPKSGSKLFNPANISSRKRAATGFSYRVPAPPVSRTGAFLRRGASCLDLAVRPISPLEQPFVTRSFTAASVLAISSSLLAENANPAHREYHDIEVPDDAGYEKRKQAVTEATDWEYPEEFGWIEIDENGDAVPETETDERLTAWLNAKLYGSYLLESWGSRTATQYAPGFGLLSSLSKEEITRLGMREVDRGGPASSVPCVYCDARLEELNRVIALNDLPFIFIDDEGPSEM